MAADQEYRDAGFIGSDQRENFKQIIAKRSDLAIFDGGRLGPSTYGTTVLAGTVLGYATSGGDADFFKPYDDSNTDGSQVAVGVLAEDAAPDTSTGYGSEISILKDAIMYQSLLIGLDAAAIVDLKATSSVEHGVTLLHIRA